MVGIWVVATAATTAIAYVAVNAAGAEVTNRPLTSVVATDATPTTTSTFPSTSLSTSPSTVTTATTAATSSTTTTNPSATTTGPPVSTTTTAAAWQQTTINSIGGSVIVSYRSGEVRLESVVPQPGFLYEIDDSGPPEVRVKLEAEEVRVEIRARWDGGLVTEVDEDT